MKVRNAAMPKISFLSQTVSSPAKKNHLGDGKATPTPQVRARVNVGTQYPRPT